MDKIFAEAAKGKRKDAANPSDPGNKDDNQELPKGVVIGKDGKPCRTCTSVKDWMKMATTESKKDPSTTATAVQENTSAYPSDCPPDVERLGTHTWTLLHSISASYPSQASSQQQTDMKQFLSLFGKLYPCWVCADDFQQWMGKKGNEPKVRGRGELGKWMCEAHNEVNRKLGKAVFDCNRWEERWRDGWKDGRCG